MLQLVGSQRAVQPLLLFLIASLVVLEQSNDCYAEDVKSSGDDETQAEVPANEVLREHENVDSVDGTAEVVHASGTSINGNYIGWPSLRLPNIGGSNVSIWIHCPEGPGIQYNFHKVFMKFHRPGDTLDSELRIDEVESQDKWDESSIDAMISNDSFDLMKPTLMYSGGWTQDSQQKWLQMVRQDYNNLFKENATGGSYNLLIFDWHGESSSIYDVASANVPHVAEMLANFFRYLHTKHKYDLSKVHLISYSLSTHIAGFASRKLAKQFGKGVGQITYMDPTGVCFHDDEEWGKAYGARHDDATLTVARHYDMYTLGAKRYIGGVDIVINDGITQPWMGVNRMTTWFDVFDYFKTFADHMRATEHEVGTEPFRLDSDCHEIAYACSSYDAFKKGECGSCGPNNQGCYLVSTTGNILIGRDPKTVGYRPGTVMFLETGLRKFCVAQYQIIVNYRESALAANKFEPKQFQFKLSDKIEVSPQHFKDNKLYQLLSLEEPLSEFPSEIIITESQDAADLAHIKNIEIKYLSNVSPEKRANYSSKYCPTASNLTLIKC